MGESLEAIIKREIEIQMLAARGGVFQVVFSSTLRRSAVELGRRSFSSHFRFNSSSSSSRSVFAVRATAAAAAPMGKEEAAAAAAAAAAADESNMDAVQRRLMFEDE